MAPKEKVPPLPSKHAKSGGKRKKETPSAMADAAASGSTEELISAAASESPEEQVRRMSNRIRNIRKKYNARIVKTKERGEEETLKGFVEDLSSILKPPSPKASPNKSPPRVPKDPSPAEPKVSPPPATKGSLPSPLKGKWADILTRDDHSIIANDFHDFLQEFTAVSDTNPFYLGEVGAMLARKSVIMSVRYDHIEKYKKKYLAMKICNNYNRLKGVLKDAAMKYIKGLKEVEVSDDVLRNLELCIVGMPKSHHTLEDMLKGKAVKKIRIYTKRTTESSKDKDKKFKRRVEGNEEWHSTIWTPTTVGRRLLRALLIYLTSAHKAGLCWNGEFDICHIQVKNNNEIVITKTPVNCSTACEGKCKDLVCVADKILPFYNEQGNPPYFEQLEISLRTIPKEVLENPTKLERYHELICYHLAVMSPISRANLITGLHNCCKSFVDENTMPIFKQHLEGHEPSGQGWRLCVMNSKNDLLLKVYNFKSQGKSVDSYDASYLSMLAFARHSFEHGTDHSRKKEGDRPAMKLNAAGVDCSDPYIDKGVQQIRLLDELELMTSVYIGALISEMIWLLVGEHEMCDMVKGIWDAYKNSDWDLSCNLKGDWEKRGSLGTEELLADDNDSNKDMEESSSAQLQLVSYRKNKKETGRLSQITGAGRR